MSRKVAREVAFKVIFSYFFNNNQDEGVKDWSERLADIISKDTELLLNGEHEDCVTNDNMLLSAEDQKFIQDVCIGVLTNVSLLDEKIEGCLKEGWTMQRIGKTDLAILRVATYEILYREDIPYKVSINEAVELAKNYCDSLSPSFINGVLATVVNSLQKDE